jgi:hypothetical protein
MAKYIIVDDCQFGYITKLGGKKKSDKSDQKNCIFGGGCHKIMFVGYNFKNSLK